MQRPTNCFGGGAWRCRAVLKPSRVSSLQAQKAANAQRKAELKRVEKKLVTQGARPFFFKKSEMKKIELAAKYNSARLSRPCMRLSRPCMRRL
eukprot:SAG11_NODE_8212_length_1046_cov_1.403379_2_plen_93_part_00